MPAEEYVAKTTKKRPKKTADKNGEYDVHVRLPGSVKARIEEMATKEKRSIPKQLAFLLESHPALVTP